MIAIRDDDLSVWTDVKEIIKLYGRFLKEGGKVSFAVIPDSVEAFHRGKRSVMYQGTERKPITENRELIDFLRPYVDIGQIEIMQHGYDHGYFVKLEGELVYLDKNLREKIGDTMNIQYIPECCGKGKKVLSKELERGRELLEGAFRRDIKVFVPPSNGLSADSAEIVDYMGMNISGTITNRLNRKCDIHVCSNVLKKAGWRVIHKEISYPRIMRYKNHLELTGYAFTPTTNMDLFYRQMKYCEQNNLPFTLATHYWELLENKKLRDEFNKIIYNKLNQNAVMTVSEEFQYYGAKC